MTADLWTPAVWTQFHTGNLTRAFRDVLLTLRTFTGRDGLYPSHATLAEKARCAVRTVQEALRQGRALGLLSWHSGAARRTSNRYQLTIPVVVADSGARLSRAASRIAARAIAVARALVGKMRGEGEQKATSGAGGQGWRNWPEPQAPIRTVAEQLELLAEFKKEEGLQKRKELTSDAQTWASIS